jgi:N-acetylglucosamine-6-phosphate deacetylase
MKCNGIDPGTGEEIEVCFSDSIESVDSLLSPSGELNYVTPGWIDLQVNGFAGVDYNSPSSSHEEINRSIRAILQTGVTRFFPTVITGSPADMLGALRNLAAARETAWASSRWEC